MLSGARRQGLCLIGVREKGRGEGIEESDEGQLLSWLCIGSRVGEAMDGAVREFPGWRWVVCPGWVAGTAGE